jgi:alpha-2-macroglobulin
MKKKYFWLIIMMAALCLLFNSCSTLNEIRVSGTNFTSEISQSQNLVFTFNKDLVSEGQLNNWDSTQYVQFEPAVRGKFKWTAPNELIFSPLAGFGSATAYKAKLTELLLKDVDKKKRYGISDELVEFHTPYLQLIETESWWTLSKESGRQEARLRLTFNYSVNAQDVAGKLKLKLGEQSATYRVLPSSEGKAITLALDNTGKADNNPTDVNIEILKGVKAQNTTYITEDIITRTTSIPSPLHLEVVDIKTGFENNTPFARIITTQEIDPESMSSSFSLNPSLETKTETTENGFIIRADFNETDTYALLINSNLKGILGPQIEEETSKDLFFGKMPAGISFVNKKAIYMTPKGSRNMGVQIVNVPKVQVRIAKLYANNILSYIRNSRYEDYEQVGEEWKPSGAFQYTDDPESNFSDLIVDKMVETENLPRNKGISALNIALPDDNARKGIYLVSVNSKDEAYMGATKLVSISDIGLIAKQGQDDIWIFANSIKTNQPLANIEITLVSSNNQSVHTATTGSDGSVHISKLSERAPGFRIAMITAGNKEDFNYLLLDDTRVETSRFEVEGQRDNVSGFQAFLYGQRDIYRPGETMHFNTVLRTQNWKTAAEVPLKLRLVTPNGREYRTWRKSTNEQGAVEIEIAVDAAALTGTYIMEVYNANDVLLASQPVSVEEFMPDRIKVDLSGAANEYASGGTVALTATAVNLFGPPAANRTYEMESQLKRKGYFAKDFPEYTFDIPAETSFEKERRQGTTNDKGQATERFALAPGIKDIGVLEGKIYVTVFDENGRPVNRLQRFDVYTQPVLYGVRLPDSYVGINAPVPVDIIGLNGKGNLQKSIAKVEVVRLEYQTVVEKKNEQLRYTSRKSEKIVYSNMINLGSGRGSFKYVPTVSGEYEVRVRRPDAEHYTVTNFYAYGYGYTQYSSFEVSNEGRVLMETDQEKYQVGETARILFKTPFDGRLLVTVERNNILEQHILTTEKKAAELKIGLKEEHLPNIYVTATLIRPLDASDMPLTVAHGFIPVLVEDSKRNLPVVITASEKSRSRVKQTIRVKTAPNAQVTLAIVDEGILQIKNSKTPDIHGFFYQKRALEVTSHDLYALLFPELNISGTSSFGGDGYDLEKRINPLSNGRTKLVTFWSGILQANGSGEISYDVNLPQFSGDLRVMAIAYKDNAFGSSSKNMKVADPVVISTGLPRFLSPGDELTLPVNISNTETKPANATVSLQLTGPLANGETPLIQKIVIPAGKETMALFSVKALQSIGAGKVKINVQALGETFSQETDITVRPASPLLKTSSSGMIAGGQKGMIDLTSSFIPSTRQSQVVFSRSPLVQGGGKALSTLLGYPFGCIEQTISKAFPQLYFADLTKAMAAPVYLVKNGESDFNPVSNVQQAIRKVESLQLFNGAMTMWPGSAQEDWWATAYAVHFLEEARRAGFEINTSTLSKATDYLTGKTRSTATKEVIIASTGNGLAYNAEPSSGSQVRKIVARRESIYALYVLALTGQPNRASMNYYKQNPQLLTTDTKYLLAGAFKLIGDVRSFNALLPKSYTAESGSQSFDDSYSSPLRNMALVLNTLLETDPDNPQISPIARQLSKAIQSASYLNTQEAAFAVLALGKIAKSTSGSTVTASVSANGKNLASFDGKELRLAKGIANQKLLVSTGGKGGLYWFSQSEGMSSTGSYAEEDQGLRIRREFLTRDGKPVGQLHQNDLVVVKLSLSSTSGLYVDNVVITDLLPAGFEIENPRITEPRDMPWITNTASPEYLDIRDDRIHFFTNADKTEKSFYYQVRIVSRGTFSVGPAAADAMYQGEYRSYSGGLKLKVE